ncbi:glutamate--tRNA ligase [Dongia sp.]|jgi:glutamyl-tRNA synthetase|uniref:glutamate--tRNA ligase n=1 Tax=Dongia sp. TaxID=1977262 RepID=UPI0035AEC3E9
MSVRVRFAPSPTGRLHVGNIYIALNNWLFARQRNGSFLLRLDDTDIERSTPEFAAGIEADLTWLGLTWDSFTRQVERIPTYDAAAARLKASGRLYPCYESAEELALKRKIHRVYDRSALKLTPEDRARLEAEGKRPYWRFKLEHRQVGWTDLVRGPEHIDTSSQSDPVLIRADGSYLYTFTSVVDDIDLAMTHIIRGADHVTNTGTQIQIFEALGASAPDFAHLPLLVDAAGEGLSKRLGSLSISDLRGQGLEPMALNTYLAYIGTGVPLVVVPHLGDLVKSHDLSKFGKSSPRFDPAELLHLNARLLHLLPFEEAKTHLAGVGLGEVDAALWDVARANVEKIEEIGEWQRICRGSIAPKIVDLAFAGQAADVLPPAPWDEGSWKIWTEAVKSATGRKGKDLFMPLRLALTGLEHGPEMRLLLPLIGRDKTLRRLRGETA